MKDSKSHGGTLTFKQHRPSRSHERRTLKIGPLSLYKHLGAAEALDGIAEIIR